ncbi:unnamed protein product [Chrysoparadoxa australica]
MHPDKLTFSSEEEEEDATAAFVLLVEAYETLSDPDKRKEYDRHPESPEPQLFNPTKWDIKPHEVPFKLHAQLKHGGFWFSYAGSGVDKCGDLSHQIAVELADLFQIKRQTLMVTRPKPCPTCHGTGHSKPHETTVCPLCQGQKKAHHLYSHDSGDFEQAVHSTCKACRGHGKVSDYSCEQCGGSGIVEETREVHVDIPVGCPDKYTVKLNGGNDHPFRPAGFIRVTVFRKPHPKFMVEGEADLVYRAKISLVDALVGFERKLSLLHPPGEVLHVVHDHFTLVDYRRTFVGRGLPLFLKPGEFGDLHVDFEVVFPKFLSKSDMLLLEGTLSPDEMNALRHLLSVMSSGEAGRMDPEELGYSSQCYIDPDTYDPRYCMPDAMAWTWPWPLEVELEAPAPAPAHREQ